MNTIFLQRILYFIHYFDEWTLNTERMRRWKRKSIVHFLFLVALSLAASILRYSSTSSTGVSSFFLDVLGVLFFCVFVQGAKGHAPTESRLV